MERQFHWQTVNLLNVTLEGRVTTQLFALMNPSADGLGQIPVCERVSHPRRWTRSVTWSVPSWARQFWWSALGFSSPEPGSFAALGPAGTGGQPVSPRLWWTFSCASSFSCWFWGCLPPWCRPPSGSPPLPQVTPGSSEGWTPADWWSVSPSGWADRCGRVGRSLPQSGLLLPQTGVCRLGLAAAWELCPGRGLMEFFLLGPLLAVPPLAATLACPQRARTVLSGLATSSFPLRRRQAVQGAEPLVWFRRGPSAWRRLAPQQIRPLANLHLGAALVGCRVAAIAVHAGEDLRVTLVVRVRTFSALGAAGLFLSALLFGVPKGLTLGAPSHRCGKSLHRERCGTKPYLSGQLRSFKGDLDACGCWVWRPPRRAPASRSCLTSFSSSPPMGIGPTTPSTTGRGIRAPMGVPPGSLSKRASLLCWASVAHPTSHFPEGSGLMERTAPTALLRSWLRCHGPSLSNLADPPPKSWITTGKSTNAGVRVLGWNCILRELPSGWLRNCCSCFPAFLEV